MSDWMVKQLEDTVDIKTAYINELEAENEALKAELFTSWRIIKHGTNGPEDAAYVFDIPTMPKEGEGCHAFQKEEYNGTEEALCRLEDKNKELQARVDEHNEEMKRMCDGKKSCGFENYERDCGNCYLDSVIELPTGEGE